MLVRVMCAEHDDPAHPPRPGSSVAPPAGESSQDKDGLQRERLCDERPVERIQGTIELGVCLLDVAEQTSDADHVERNPADLDGYC